MHMGVFCKIFMSFKLKFWSNQAYFCIASDKKGYYPAWRPLDQYYKRTK